MNDRVTSDRTALERRSEREIVVTRTFDAPVRIVYDAWSKSELFQLWWPPAASPVPLLSCEMDVRTGGGYRLAFGHDAANAMVFFGRYLEVIPQVRIVWTNEESPDAAVTTVTFEEQDGKTLVVLTELYASKEAFEAAGGAEEGLPMQFDQLAALLPTLS